LNFKVAVRKVIGLNTFFVLIFVVFVADGSHFDRMFKMVITFIKCLKCNGVLESTRNIP